MHTGLVTGDNDPMRSTRLGLAPLASIGFGIGYALWTWLTFAGALTGLDAIQAPVPRWQDPRIQIAAAVAVGLFQ